MVWFPGLDVQTISNVYKWPYMRPYCDTCTKIDLKGACLVKISKWAEFVLGETKYEKICTFGYATVGFIGRCIRGTGPTPSSSGTTHGLFGSPPISFPDSLGLGITGAAETSADRIPIPRERGIVSWDIPADIVSHILGIPIRDPGDHRGLPGDPNHHRIPPQGYPQDSSLPIRSHSHIRVGISHIPIVWEYTQ